MTTATTSPAAGLYRKLASISADVGQIKATGRTAQGTSTISISDVEDALRELLAKHGVVTGYRWNATPSVVGQEGKLTVWLADLIVWLVNADNPTELREDRVCDIGSSPSGAVSFALKRYYRALFHLADEEDETRSARVQTRGDAVPHKTVVNEAIPVASSAPLKNAQVPSRDEPLGKEEVKARCEEIVKHLGIKPDTLKTIWTKLGESTGGLGATEDDWTRMMYTLDQLSTGTYLTTAIAKAMAEYPHKPQVVTR